MSPRARRTVRRSLVDELLRNHRIMLQVLALLLAVALVTVGYLVNVAQPRLERYIEMSFHARNAQIASLEQSVDLRGWLATGDTTYLETFEQHRAEARSSIDDLVELVSGDDTPGLTDRVVETAVARSAWADWADGVVAANLGSLLQDHDSTRAGDDLEDHQAIRTELAEGRGLYGAYRQASARSTGQLIEQRDAALRSSRWALLTGLSVFVVALLVTAFTAYRRRRSVVDEVVVPTEQLLDTITALREGDLSATSPRSGVDELDEVGAALDELAASLDRAQQEATGREARLASLATRFETVVRVAREIAGSLSVRYVSATVTGAATDLLGAPTLLWVRGEDQAFHVTSRSEDPRGVVPPQELVPPDVVLAAAADARPVSGGGARAYPLVLAGMVVGVLESRRAGVDADTDQVLEALLSTAAAALESATLHSAARELADVDALTRLPNRRRFEGDMEAEWDRCRRYGRPMCLVMLDLDHFKTLNDEHGHLFGDEVLRGAAEALGAALRTSDTAYRYGGEEFAVLLRETGLEDGQEVAERLRRAISDIAVPRHGVLVTASAGVAERVSTMAHHTELVARADAALYRAKHGGRDQVVAAAE